MSIDLDSWQAIAAGIALVAVTIHGKWEAYRTRKKAEKAVELSAPTGNGFAKKVTETLERIESRGERTETLLLEHLASHADAHVHSTGGRLKRDLTEL